MRLIGRKAWLAFSALALAGAACGGSGSADALKSGGKCVPQKTPVITLAAYSTVYDVYGKLTTAFQDQWKTDHDGQSVIFQSSFGGSTTQAQNVANGFPADVVALSLAPDVEIVQKAGLITHDWTKDPDGSIVATQRGPGRPTFFARSIHSLPPSRVIQRACWSAWTPRPPSLRKVLPPSFER